MKPNYSSARGFSLTELLVSMTIGLFLIGGAIQVLVHNKQAYGLISDTLDIQDSARFATRRIGNLFRMAGHRGGVLKNQVEPNFSNLTGDGVCQAKWMVSKFVTEPVRGYTNGSGIVDTGDCATAGIVDANHVNNTDILVVRHSEAQHESNPGSGGNADRLFVYTVVSSGAKLGKGSAIATAWTAFSGQSEKVYGRYVYPYYTDIYYIRPWSKSATESPQVPALVRLRMDGASNTTEVMVSGVEFMKVEFGVDSDSDGQIDLYQAPGGIADWSEVMLARLAIIARSMGRDAEVEDTNTYVLLPGRHQTSYTPGTDVNQYARMQFEVSVHLRNTVGVRQAN